MSVMNLYLKYYGAKRFNERFLYEQESGSGKIYNVFKFGKTRVIADRSGNIKFKTKSVSTADSWVYYH